MYNEPDHNTIDSNEYNIVTYSSVLVNTTLRIKMAEFTTSASKKQKTQESHGESSEVVEKEKNKKKERTPVLKWLKEFSWLVYRDGNMFTGARHESTYNSTGEVQIFRRQIGRDEPL